MKNIVLLSVLTLSLIAFSCKKEVEITEPIEVNASETINSTDYVDYKVILTKNPMLKTSGIPYAKVTLTLNNEIVSKVTDSNGIALFENIKAGTIPVKVESEHFIPVMYTVDLSQGSLTEDNSQSEMNAVTSIKMFPKTAGTIAAQLKGRVRADLDLTNDTTGTFTTYKPGENPELVADSTKIVAFLDYKPDEVYSNIVEINYEVQRIEAYTIDGYYIFQLPEGTYDVYLRPVDFEADQKVFYPLPEEGVGLDNSILYKIEEENMFFRADPVKLEGVKLVEGSAVVNDVLYQYYDF